VATGTVKWFNPAKGFGFIQRAMAEASQHVWRDSCVYCRKWSGIEGEGL